MDVDCALPPADSLSPPTYQADDLYLADLLKVADDNIARLRKEVQVAVDDRVGLEAKVDNMRKQVYIYSWTHNITHLPLICVNIYLLSVLECY